MPLNADGRVALEASPDRFIEPADREPLPQPGSTVELCRRLETFGGFITAGSVQIAASYYDHYGERYVNLARAGITIASGVAWPIDPIPKATRSSAFLENLRRGNVPADASPLCSKGSANVL